MPIKLFIFNFSPCARFTHLVAKLTKAEVEFVEVDLSKAEQLKSEFLTVNPKVSWENFVTVKI